MHLRRLFVLVFTILVSALGAGQGLLWQQNIEADEVSIARASNGDIYVVGVTYTPSITPIVACYGANGTLKLQDVQGGFGTYQASVHSATISGDYLYFIVNFGNQFSRLYKVNTATYSSTSTLIQSNGSSMGVTSLAIGTTDYCLTGTRVSDGQGVIQVRSLSDDTILKEVWATHNLSGVLRASGYYFAYGNYVSGAERRFVVHRISDTAYTLRSMLVPTTSGSFATTPVMGTLTGSGTLALACNFQDLSWGTLYVVRFDTGTLTFGPLWSDTFENMLALSPLGLDRFVVALANRFVAFESNGLEAFVLNYPDFMSPMATTGTAVVDSTGNAVFALSSLSTKAWLYRLSPSGFLLNSTQLGIVPATLGEATIDSAGVTRFVCEQNYSASDWRLCAVSQGGLTLPSTFVVGGSSPTGTINIGGPAPAGGATFDLFSNNAAAIVPTTVTIPAGQTSVGFTITTSAVAANTKPTINARYGGIVLQNNFDLAAPLVQSVTATPQSQYGGVNITGSVVLTGPAPTGGKTVTLTSSNTSKVTVPANLVVPAGASSANFVMTTFPTLVNASSVVTATTGAVSKTVFVAVVAPVFQNATLATNSIKGGQSTTMTLTIGTPAPSGYTITLASGATGFVQLPSSFAIPAGQTTANVPVSTSPVTSNTPVTLFAYRGPYIKTMTLTLTP